MPFFIVHFNGCIYSFLAAKESQSGAISIHLFTVSLLFLHPQYFSNLSPVHDILDKGVNKITDIWWFIINVPYLFVIHIPDNIFCLKIWIICILYVSVILNTTDEKCSYCCLAFVLRVQYKISIIFHVEYDSMGGISYCFQPFWCWGRKILGKATNYTMAAVALAPNITRASAAMILNIHDE